MRLRRLPNNRLILNVCALIGIIGLLLTCFFRPAAAQESPVQAKTKTIEIPFKSHDGYDMFGKLTLPVSNARCAVVIYVQTAEGMTVDMKRPIRNTTFNYFDLYREKLPEMNVAFFGYEGRGIRMGDAPPRYEKIDWDIYNTSTLENKVRDIMSAVQVVQKQAGIDPSRIFLMGASEGTLLAAEAASRIRKEIAGLVLYGVMSANLRETYKYIMTGGNFIAVRGFFDKDKDGKISKAEFEADPAKFREKRWNNAGFEVFDRNQDGYFTVEDMGALSKIYLDAADTDNYEVLNGWLKIAAAVSTPEDWFKDHFAHQPIWTFLSQLDIPIGCFHGDEDASVPIEGLKKMKETAKKAGKTKMEFHYFAGLDHSLNVGLYFLNGTMPEGHKAIFEFIKNQVRGKQPSN